MSIAQKKGRVDIGGQAVMEGVMMKSPTAIAIALRKDDGSIVVKREEYSSPTKKHPWMGWPIIRGIINMGTMFSMGMRTLQTSTEMLGLEEEVPSKFELWLSKTFGKSIDKIIMGVAVVLAVILSVGLFIILPEFVASLVRRVISNKVVVNLISGAVRIAILIAYMVFCSYVPDVRRTFQYHGAEHKTVYCFENKLPLTPKNAQTFSTLHPRCGTSFILIVFLFSILLYTFAGYNGTNYILRVLSRLALLPVVAGVSYELLKGLAHADGKLVRALRWPGLMMQKLTTKQPDDQMVEVAIVAMESALYGLPQGELTPEGFTKITSFPPVFNQEEEPGEIAEEPIASFSATPAQPSGEAHL